MQWVGKLCLHFPGQAAGRHELPCSRLARRPATCEPARRDARRFRQGAARLVRRTLPAGSCRRHRAASTHRQLRRSARRVSWQPTTGQQPAPTLFRRHGRHVLRSLSRAPLVEFLRTTARRVHRRNLRLAVEQRINAPRTAGRRLAPHARRRLARLVSHRRSDRRGTRPNGQISACAAKTRWPAPWKNCGRITRPTKRIFGFFLPTPGHFPSPVAPRCRTTACESR